MLPRVLSCVFIVLFILINPASAALSTDESHIRDLVVQQQTTQINLLKKLVNINSGTTNVKGVYRTGEIIRKELRQLGFKTRWVYEPAAMHRAPTLIAERLGKHGKHLLLIGHLDTVFAPDQTVQRANVKGEMLKGPGVLDDKGGVVVMLYALKALNKAHALQHTTITVVLTGDEEEAGKPVSISRKPLLAAAKTRDIALDFEPTITLETATIARRGIVQWRVAASGNESHSATIFQPEVGSGAIFEIARILQEMRLQLAAEKYVSFNPGMVVGGTTIEDNRQAARACVFGKQNVVAKTAFVDGDLRFINAEQKESMETKMQSIVVTHLQGTKSTITFEEGIPAMIATEANQQLLQQYSDVSIDLGEGAIKPLDAGIRGAGDISHVAVIVPANLAGLGPMGIGTHTVIEKLVLSSLPVQTKRAAILIYRLTR